MDAIVGIDAAAASFGRTVWCGQFVLGCPVAVFADDLATPVTARAVGERIGGEHAADPALCFSHCDVRRDKLRPLVKWRWCLLLLSDKRLLSLEPFGVSVP